jgi:hypothetical protein
VKIVTDFPELAGPSGSSDQMTEARDYEQRRRMCGALFLAAICHGGKADLSSPTSDLCFLLFAFSVPAAAQQAGKVYRIGLCRWARPKFTGVE